MSDANGCCIGDVPNLPNYKCSLVDNNGQIPYHLREANKSPEEKLADREKELSALKGTCMEIKFELQVLMREIKSFTSTADTDFYRHMVQEAEKNLNEAVDVYHKKIPELEKKLMENIFRHGLCDLILDQLK